MSSFGYDGTHLSFSAAFDMSGQFFELKGEGTINGNNIEGTLSSDMTGKSGFTGRKED